MNKAIITLGIFFSLFLLQVVPALAQGVTGGGTQTYPNNGQSNSQPRTVSNQEVKFDNPFRYQSVQEFVGALIKLLIKIGTIIAFFFIIYAGFLFVTAGGDTGKIEDAKKTFLTTIIGVAIVLGASVINTLLQGTANSIIGR